MLRSGLCTYMLFLIIIFGMLYFISALCSLALVRHRHRSQINGEFSDQIDGEFLSKHSPVNTQQPFSLEEPQIIDPPEGHFISMCSMNFDERGLGNQLFNFAALLYATKHVNEIASEYNNKAVLPEGRGDGLNDTGNYGDRSRRLNAGRLKPFREVIMPEHHPHGWMDEWFEISVKRYQPGPDRVTEGLCPPCSTLYDEGGLAFSSSLHSRLRHLVKTRSHHRAFLLCGYFQSWKYILGIEEQLRQQLRLKDQMSARVEKFLADNRPFSSTKALWDVADEFLRVGLHVRRGDILAKDSINYGYTVVSREYLKRAMQYFSFNTTKLVQFIVVSDDLSWTKEAIRLNGWIGNNTSLVYSEHPTIPVFDLALLSRCDAVIMTTGTFGWWGAWLANGTTIYYSEWPTKNSKLDQLINKDDYFPPNWIPMS